MYDKLTKTDDDEGVERTLAISYAPADIRPALTALFGLDDALASLLRTTREPAIAQIRLAWWRERLAELDRMPPPAMPVLEAVAREIVGRGVPVARLVSIVEGWEVLVEAEALDQNALLLHAVGRGGGLFGVASAVLGQREFNCRPGEGWALSDLYRHLSSPTESGLARTLAGERLAGGLVYPSRLRALGALATLARMNLAIPQDRALPVGAPRRVARLAWMRLSGR